MPSAMLGNLGDLSGSPVMCIRGQSLEYLTVVGGSLLDKAHFTRAAAPTTAAFRQESHPPLYCFVGVWWRTFPHNPLGQ